jgi:hypothetical protein
MSEKIDNTRASVGHSIGAPLERFRYSSTDPDSYMHHGEQLPPGLHQRITPDLAPITNFCADISSHVYKLGFTGLRALTFERKMLDEIAGMLITFRDPKHGPLLSVVQQFMLRVTDQINNILGQPDLLEQENRVAKPRDTSVRDVKSAGTSPTADAAGEGDSEFCGGCGLHRDKHHSAGDRLYCLDEHGDLIRDSILKPPYRFEPAKTWLDVRKAEGDSSYRQVHRCVVCKANFFALSPGRHHCSNYLCIDVMRSEPWRAPAGKAAGVV